jgi:hypothetical protein
MIHLYLILNGARMVCPGDDTTEWGSAEVRILFITIGMNIALTTFQRDKKPGRPERDKRERPTKENGKERASSYSREKRKSCAPKPR